MKPRMFFTSDQHFGNENIIGFCRQFFGTLDNMHDAIIENWNRVVRPWDTVVVVGDFCMGNRFENLKFSQQLLGNKILVPGNHDHCWKGGASGGKLADWRHVYEDAGFILMDELWIAGPKFEQRIQVCHFPFMDYTEARHMGRYDAHNPEDKGQHLIHGHTHKPEKVSGPRSIHVGVDAWNFTPVDRDWIFTMIEEGLPDDVPV